MKTITSTAAHGCCVCRRFIRAGEAHYFDNATRDRYHVACKPEESGGAPRTPRPRRAKIDA